MTREEAILVEEIQTKLAEIRTNAEKTNRGIQQWASFQSHNLEKALHCIDQKRPAEAAMVITQVLKVARAVKKDMEKES